MICARKMNEFYMIIARKKYFPDFGEACVLPPSPIRQCVNLAQGALPNLSHHKVVGEVEIDVQDARQ